MTTDGGLRVLVIDDDEVDRIAIARALDRSPGRYQIDEASTVAEGLQRVAGAGAEAYDCVVVDFNLPDGDACGFLDGVRPAEGRLTTVPVVVVTGGTSEARGVESIRRGAQDYLFKNDLAQPALLSRAVRYAIDRHKLREDLELNEKQLRQAETMDAIGQLAGGIAHDFNNMLTAILGFSTRACAKLSAEDVGAAQIQGARDDMTQVIRAAERSAALTQQILAFARNQEFRPETVDLRDLVSDSARLLGRLIAARITLRAELSDAPCCVEIDPGQLERVVLNLALNARDAIGADVGEITLGVARAELSADEPELKAGSYVVLSVADTGAGMDPGTVARAFEPFFTSKPSGNGLGLSTVHGVVRQSGGRVDVESELGVGTTFRIYLPLVAAAAAKASPVEPPGEPASSGEVVLVVEDEPLVRELLADVLAPTGYEVLLASDGDEALQVSATHPGTIDLLLTDITMPGLSGYELVHQLEVARPDMKVVYMSGYSKRSAESAGALVKHASFLQKPVAPRELLRVVRDVLAAPRGVA